MQELNLRLKFVLKLVSLNPDTLLGPWTIPGHLTISISHPNCEKSVEVALYKDAPGRLPLKMYQAHFSS